MAMLEHHDRVAHQVAGIREVIPAARVIAQDPAHVREPEAALRAVRILVDIVDEQMMRAVLRSPHEDAVLHGHRAEEREEAAHGPVRLVGAVRPEPVIARRDRDATGPQEHEQADPGCGAEALRESVPRDQDQRGQRRQREDNRRDPVDRRMFVGTDNRVGGHGRRHSWE
jgi:hypothetical protein